MHWVVCSSSMTISYVCMYFITKWQRVSFQDDLLGNSLLFLLHRRNKICACAPAKVQSLWLDCCAARL